MFYTASAGVPQGCGSLCKHKQQVCSLSPLCGGELGRAHPAAELPKCTHQFSLGSSSQAVVLSHALLHMLPGSSMLLHAKKPSLARSDWCDSHDKCATIFSFFCSL